MENERSDNELFISEHINKLSDFEIIALKDILVEYQKAKKKHPKYPNNDYKAIAIITEEVGELAQAILDREFGKKTISHVQEEAAQVGAMGLRFLANSIDKELPF